MQNRPDFQAVLGELKALGLDIEYEPANQNYMLAPEISPRLLKVLGNASLPGFDSVSGPRQLSSSSPPLAALSGPQDRYSTFPNRQRYMETSYRPLSQPIESYFSLQPDQQSWSPASLPSRPATTIGIPGFLGEGIYKISKISSASSGRPRMRRISTIRESHGPRLYTVSKHFDKTLSRGDIYIGRKPSSDLRPDGTNLERPKASVVNHGFYSSRQQDTSGLSAPMRIPYTLDTAQAGIRDLARLRRTHTVDGSLVPGSTKELPGFAETGATFANGYGIDAKRTPLTSPNSIGGISQPTFSQPEPTPRGQDSIGYTYGAGIATTSIGESAKQEARDDWLLQMSQVYHEGLCEVSRIWDDFMAKGAVKTASIEGPEHMSGALSAYEGEFTQRWNGIVASTVQKMRELQTGGLDL